MIHLGGSLVLNFLYSFFTMTHEFNLQGFDGQFSKDILIVSLVNVMWSFICFTVFSFSMRWWSRNGSKKPFPL